MVATVMGAVVEAAAVAVPPMAAEELVAAAIAEAEPRE
jgi:hypothetical protein